MNNVHIVFGSQGAGKSTYARQLARQVNGVHFSIDEWMWKLYGPDLPQPMNMPWVMERVGRCEKRIWDTARQVAACGVSVVLDLGFMKAKDRERFTALAKEEGLSAQLHYVDAPYAVRLKRVTERNLRKGETFSFEVSPAMFDVMEKEFEAPTEEELSEAVVVQTGAD